MCNSKDCPGHPDAPSKEACRACYGVHYKSTEDNRDDWMKERNRERIRNECISIAKAVLELENLLNGKVDRETLYNTLCINGDVVPGRVVCMMIEGRQWDPELL